MIKRILIQLVLILGISASAMAQYSSSNKKAVALFDQALGKYGAEMYQEAIQLCGKSLKLDPNFVEVLWLKAEIAEKQHQYDTEIEMLSKALTLKPGDATTVAAMGDAYFAKYDNPKAVEYYSQLLNMDRATEKLTRHCMKYKEIAEFRIKAMANPVDYNPKNLGPYINTKYNDYFPSLSADGNTLVYTIELPQTSQNPLLPQTQEDIYISRRNDGQPWQQAKSIGAIINTHNNEGAPFLSADGRILFFTSCTCPDGMIKCCDIYFSYLKEGEFTMPRRLPAPVNTGAWESQPSFSADGKTLYFVSNRPGGMGGKDIWYSTLIGAGRWSEPKNCGPNVNTEGDESSPFIHADNKTLYFSSNGHIGMGGDDIFVSRLQDDGTWGPATNLGYPINTASNEGRLAVSVFGNTAIIASDRDTSRRLDLFEINLPKHIQPNRTLLVEALVKDANTNSPIKASYEVVALSTAKALQTGTCDGGIIPNLLLYLPEGEDYALNVRADGYLMNSLNFSLRNIPDSVTKKYIEIALSKPEIGTTVTLANIFFETDRYNLMPESHYELDRLVEYMKQNPSIRIEIGGHTDNAGTEAHNLELSTNRAMAIVNYLMAKDIPPSRLSYRGYGSSMPCAPNDSPENMAKNRRTEFKIVK